MDEPITLTVDFAATRGLAGLYRRAIAKYPKRAPFFGGPLLWCVLKGAAAGMLIALVWRLEPDVVRWISIGAIAVAFIADFMMPRAALDVFAQRVKASKFASEPVEYVFSQEGVRTNGHGFGADLAWSAVDGVIAMNGGLAIYYSGSVFVIPDAAFPSDQPKDAVVARAEEWMAGSS